MTDTADLTSKASVEEREPTGPHVVSDVPFDKSQVSVADRASTSSAGTTELQTDQSQDTNQVDSILVAEPLVSSGDVAQVSEAVPLMRSAEPLPPQQSEAPRPSLMSRRSFQRGMLGLIGFGLVGGGVVVGRALAAGNKNDSQSDTLADSTSDSNQPSESSNSPTGETNPTGESGSEANVLQASDLQPIYVDSALTDESMATTTLANMDLLRNADLPSDPVALDALLDVVYHEDAIDNREFIVDSNSQAYAMRLNFPDASWTQSLDYVVPGSGVETPTERSFRAGTTSTGPTETAVREATMVYHPVLLDSRYQWKFYTFRDIVTLGEQSR